MPSCEWGWPNWLRRGKRAGGELCHVLHIPGQGPEVLRRPVNQYLVSLQCFVLNAPEHVTSTVLSMGACEHVFEEEATGESEEAEWPVTESE